jgi:hypothetical protein
MKPTPAHLGSCGKRFWKRILREYNVEEAHHYELLSQAAACLDRIEQARQRVEADGAFVVDRYGQTRAHAGVIIERDCRRLFAALCRELCLDIQDPADAPRGKGRY